ncbi:MAG: hypothetical protein U0792_16575 [Gemmataceae bacterium]
MLTRRARETPLRPAKEAPPAAAHHGSGVTGSTWSVRLTEVVARGGGGGLLVEPFEIG